MADAENKLYRIVGTTLVPMDAQPDATAEQPDATAEPKKPAKSKTTPTTDEGVSDASNTN